VRETEFAKPLACPHCGSRIDGSLPVNHDVEAEPLSKEVCSIMICIGCAQPNMLDTDADGKLVARPFTEEEYCDLPGEILQLIVRAQATIRVMNSVRRMRAELEGETI
jgi:hypothetical protein